MHNVLGPLLVVVVVVDVVYDVVVVYVVVVVVVDGVVVVLECDSVSAMEEVPEAADLHLCGRHPHLHQSFPETQHLL